MNQYRDAFTFMEDRFDLDEFKQTTNAMIRHKASIRNSYRIIAAGRTIIAIGALAVAVLFYWLIATTFVVH